MKLWFAVLAVLVRIPGGSFDMGVDAPEAPSLAARLGLRSAALLADAMPKHRVTVAPFEIDRYEVTDGEFNPTGDRSIANRPVVNVTWSAAAAFCASRGLRLPTEAEWDYAARGGLADPLFPWGDDPPSPSRVNYGASGIGHAVDVGSYAPNGYGLFDMAGNVWEFLADAWQRYGQAALTGAVTTRRVIRGGSWGGAPVNLWIGYRDSHPENNPTDFVGFRCARSQS